MGKLGKFNGMVKLIPPNGVTFTLRESFLYMKTHEIIANKFYNLVTNERVNPKHPKFLFHLASFCRKYKKFKITIILPYIDDKRL